MIDVDEARTVYAEYLGKHAKEKKAMDAAFMHVVEWVYRRAFADGEKEGARVALQQPPP